MSNLSGTRGDEFERNQVANVVGVGDGRPTEKQNVERLLARCASWPYRCGLYTSSQNRSVRFRNAQDYFGIGKVPIPCSRVFQVFDGSFDSPYAMAGWFNCRRDLDGLYLVCSTTRDRFTAQELIFETLTLCVRGRVLSILLCISAWHREGANFGPT